MVIVPHRGDLVVAVEPGSYLAERAGGGDRILATVLFTDIAESTKRASQLGDQRWRELLEAHDLSVRRQVAAHGGRVLKSMGDGHLATFDGPARAIRGGCALGRDAESLGLRLKVGVHTGECERMGDDVAGMAVHIGARVLAKACPGEVLATSAVRDLVLGSGIEFRDRGAHELRGVPGVWRLLAVAHSGTGARTSWRVARRAPAMARLLSRASLRRSRSRSRRG
jgi:class 3 adenylate cyclase